jgi:hypothetical protein
MRSEESRKVETVLSDHTDWKEWIHEVKRVAMAQKVWEYIDVSNPSPKPIPTEPELEVTDSAPRQLRSGTQNTPEPDAIRPHDRTFELEIFRIKHKAWERYEKGIQVVDTYIFEHLDKKNRVYIRNLDNTRDILMKLSKLFSMTTKQERINLVDRYRQIIKIPKTYNPEAWAARWESVVNECREANLPDVQDERHKEDFILTTEHIMPQFFQIWNAKLIDSISGGDDLPELDVLLERFLAYAKQAKRTSRKQANATFQNQPEANRQNKKEDKKNQTRKGPPCPSGVCNHEYGFINCPYINHEKRGAGFKEDPDAIKSIRIACINNPKIKFAYDRIVKELRKKDKNDIKKSVQAQVAKAKADDDIEEASEYYSDDSEIEEIQRPSMALTTVIRKPKIPMTNYIAEEVEDDDFKTGWIYDTGASVHICNDRSRFVSFKPRETVVGVGDTSTRCEGVGNVILYPTKPLDKASKGTILLKKVRYSPGFHTNLFSASKGEKMGIRYDSESQILRINGTPLCKIKVADVYYMTWTKRMEQVFAVSKRTSKQKSILKSSDDFWHRRLGHASPEIVKHLEEATIGAKVISTQRQEGEKCEECLLSTSNRQISRVPRERGKRPFENLHLDLIQNNMGYNGDNWVTHLYCDYSHFHIIITTRSKSIQFEVIWVLKFIQKEFGVPVTRVYSDGEASLGDEWHKYCKSEDIQFFQTVPGTPEQNGFSERSGGVISGRARALIIDSRLPTGMWPEAYKSAVFILNRTPTKQLGWKTPYEVAYSETKSGKTNCKPYIGNLYKFGSRAYARIQNIPGKDKVHPRAQIGYLVGYEAHNIWKIWLPHKPSTVIRVRDCQFDETKKYDPDDPFKSFKISESMPQRIVTSDLPKIGNMEDVDVENDVFEGLDDNGNLAQAWQPTTGAETRETAPAPTNQANNEQIGQEITTEGLIRINLTPEEASHGQSHENRELTPISQDGGTGEKHVEFPRNHSHRLPNAAPEKEILPYQTQESDAPRSPPETPIQIENRDLTSTPGNGDNLSPTSQPQAPGSASPSRSESMAAPAATTGEPPAVASRDINLNLSESNIVTGSRMRQASRRAQEAEEEELSRQAVRANKRKRRANLVKDMIINEEIMAKTFMTAALSKDQLHQSQLPEPPNNWRELRYHPLRDGFYKAAETEYIGIQQKGAWTEIAVPDDEKIQILPMKWVFTYKLDNNGYLLKYKARICVRGDLQKMTHEDTRAATLAAQTFRTMMALAAAFDLEIWQCDAVNAFINSFLDETVYMRFPDGFKVPGKCLRLIRALYGLKRAPRLWQKELSKKLEEFGFTKVKEDECLFISEGMILMFFVDDIIVIYHRQDQQRFDKFRKKFVQTYEVREMPKFEWFLGIRILRDRDNYKLWLIQDAYIDKIANQYNLTKHRKLKTPITRRYQPHKEQATAREIHAFQKRVGSLQYAVTGTRADASFAGSHLATFLRNPAPEHLTAVEDAIAYLYQTRERAIEYSAPAPGENEVFIVASDAAYADNPDRKSTQGALYKLYGGIVEWHTRKQKTVTTSTTDAELLSLSEAARQIRAWIRLFEAIGFDPEHQIHLLCDNKQTVGLMVKEDPPYRTKLRHVDIMGHWLRQEVQDRRLSIKWIPTAEMPADGLTKPLPHEKHRQFIKQLGMVNIDHLLKNK